MGALFRYALVFVLAAGGMWLLTRSDLSSGGKTLLEQLLAYVPDVPASGVLPKRSETEEERPPAVKPSAPVAKLQQAATEVHDTPQPEAREKKSAPTEKKAPRTHLDERIRPSERKALDNLLNTMSDK